jgi:hypothetical protein
MLFRINGFIKLRIKLMAPSKGLKQDWWQRDLINKMGLITLRLLVQSSKPQPLELYLPWLFTLIGLLDNLMYLMLFLQGTLNEEVYIEQPLGFQDTS